MGFESLDKFDLIDKEHFVGLKTVINYDAAVNPDAHVHRIGRTGRAGEGGIAYTLLIPKQERDQKLAPYLVKSLKSMKMPVGDELLQMAGFVCKSHTHSNASVSPNQLLSFFFSNRRKVEVVVVVVVVFQVDQEDQDKVHNKEEQHLKVFTKKDLIHETKMLLKNLLYLVLSNRQQTNFPMFLFKKRRQRMMNRAQSQRKSLVGDIGIKIVNIV